MRRERLLDVRLRELELRIEGSVLAGRIRQLEAELGRRGIVFRPYFWLSDDWFTPEGLTGTAIPFYLAHPRLLRLERSIMGEVEGGTRTWCMKILRHETGHAFQHAYGLHRRRRWQQLFGHTSRPYPRYYQPNPYSKRHVQHLEYWYAQSHPDEDFAETFAVWVAPRSAWRKRYQGWPALKKLQYVDELMAELAGRRPPRRTRTKVDPVSRMGRTLKEFYEARRYKAEEEWPDVYDRDLCRLFSDSPFDRDHGKASAFIRKVKPEVLPLVSRWVGEHHYHLVHVLREIIGRCRDLDLRAVGGRERLKRDFAILLTKYTMDALYRNRGWIEL